MTIKMRKRTAPENQIYDGELVKLGPGVRRNLQRQGLGTLFYAGCYFFRNNYTMYLAEQRRTA